MFPQIFGKYVLERELASGGMARVYLATLRGAVGFEKRLVVKQIRPELSLDEGFVRRFVEEAKIAVELSHPNIVPVYELGVELGIYYIAMELCEGLTLTEVLAETGPLDAAEGALVGIEICRALDYAHRRGGIVHRDVTPRNVLIDEEGAVRLIDFGIAAPVTRAGDERVEVFGSPGHMPPEQIRGEALTPATDVFAVGALLIEAWTGRPPFRRGSFEASAAALNEPLPDLARDRPELEPVADVVSRAVALSPADRPPDAEALARKLRDFTRQFDSGDLAKRIGERVRRARKRLPSAAPWRAGESGPHTPAATPQALFSSRPPRPPHTPITPPMPQSRPDGAVPVTRTFAARDDLVEWTRKIASVPPEAEGLAKPHAAPPPSLSPSSPLGAEEPATRAMPRSKPPRVSTSLPWAIAGAAAALLVIVVLGARRAPSVASSSRTGSATALAALVPVAPVSSAAVGAPAATPSAAASSPATRPGAAAKGKNTPAPVAEVSAQLKLTADPPATVTIVGGRIAQSHVTPVRGLKLPPGVYSVTFRSATFGDPVAARVELPDGASRSVHADFRAAIPQVVVR
jgi:eukaryotic-like serine/threonine-protein kinase